MRSAIRARRLALCMSLVAISGTARAAEPAAPVGPSDTAGRTTPRSHLQPVGEMVRTAPSVATGLRLVRAPQVLREQLGIERGAGLVVEAVQADSAAAQAGFLVNDVVVRIDDQLMLLPEQFVAFVQTSPGTRGLTCHILRAGMPVVIQIGPLIGTVDSAQPAPDGLRAAAPTRALLADMAPTAPQPPTAPAQPAAAAMPGTVPAETLVRRDADYSIRLTAGDETRLVVTDRQGRLVFNDCIDTPEARSRLPRVVRERVEGMERHLEHRDGVRRRPVAEIGQLDVAPILLR